MEQIKCAAIIYKEIVYEGQSHVEIGHKMLRDGVCQRPFPSGPSQGFVTDTARFVDRNEAMTIAINAKQITFGHTIHEFELFSEDLRGTVPPEKYWINRNNLLTFQ